MILSLQILLIIRQQVKIENIIMSQTTSLKMGDSMENLSDKIHTRNLVLSVCDLKPKGDLPSSRVGGRVRNFVNVYYNYRLL